MKVWEIIWFEVYFTSCDRDRLIDKSRFSQCGRMLKWYDVVGIGGKLIESKILAYNAERRENPRLKMILMRYERRVEERLICVVIDWQLRAVYVDGDVLVQIR